MEMVCSLSHVYSTPPLPYLFVFFPRGSEVINRVLGLLSFGACRFPSLGTIRRLKINSKMSDGEAKVESIFVYPVKSCRGISVSQAPLTSTGLRWDRQWLVVNSKGRMYTQRVEPKLALIEVHMPVEAFSEPDWTPNKTSFLGIRAPGMNDLQISMVEPNYGKSDGVSVWEWSGSAFDEGDQAANWFSDFIGKPSRLVRFDEASESRHVNSDYARSHTIKFNDLYPFLLLSQGSLDALNHRLSEPIPVNRFRPNVVVDGCEPFAEDLWHEIKINDSIFLGGELCYRCKVPTVNQDTAVMGAEPTQTLTTFRSDKILRPNNEKHRGRVYMGQFLVCTNYTPETGKTIRVGDPVHVLKAFSSYVDCLI